MVDLLGRQREFDVVRRFLEDAAVAGRALLLTGPAGIGRTAVLEMAMSTASAAGAWVARAQGVADETDVPFAGLSQLLAPLDEVVERLDPGPHAILAAVLGRDQGAGPLVDGGVVVAAVVAALEEAAGARPVVLGVDDLPMMDVQSAECLRLLGRQLPGRRISLLATARTGGEVEGLPEHRLAPLDEEAAAALLATRAPWLSRSDRERLLREADGNPLLLCELPLWPGQALGPHLVSLFGDRVAALSTAARRLLLRAALADPCDLDVLLGMGVPAADDLCQAGLVEVIGARIVFVHPAVPVTVTAAATATERRRAHAALAGALADRPERRLWHLSEASTGPDEGIANGWEESARHLLERGDAAGAIAAFDRCTSLTPPGVARSRRAARAAYTAAAVGGDLDGVATRLSPEPGSGASLWAAAARAQVLVQGDGDLDAAHHVLVDAVEAVGVDPETEPAALTAALDTLLLACRLADRPALWSSLCALVARHGTRIPPDFAPSLRGEGVVPADRHDPTETVRVGWSLLAVDRLECCGPALRRVLDDGLRGGAAGSGIGAAVLLMLDAFSAGRWDEAGLLAEQAQVMCASRGGLAMLARAGQALVAACRGDEVACREHTTAMIGWAAPRDARLVHRYAVHARVLAALGRGDAETAYHQACSVTRPGVFGPDDPGRLLVMDLVEAAVRTGRHDEAVAHVRAAQDAGVAAVSARTALVVAGAAALAEQGEQARSRYEEALAVPGAQAWPFDVARVRLAYGEHLRRSRATLAARLELTTSLATFRRLGAEPWIARAESELRAAGHRTPRVRGGVPRALSHQERTVAGLAATGATNRQIGERLGLSHRTVGSHLTRVFQKLGVTSRAALGEALRAVSQD
ncbi:MAG TPA: LuxR family transcriptional regulator [Pseudonocardia sp.]